VLIARSVDKLERLGAELTARHEIRDEAWRRSSRNGLTAEITYAEILPGGSLRAGVFRGFAAGT